MENLGDILKRLGTTGNIANGETQHRMDNEGVQSNAPAESVCAICRGHGWFTPDVPAGHPEFGRIVTCECQRERLGAERSSRLLRYSNLGHLQRFTFETLNPRGRADDLESQRMFGEAYQAALEYASDPKGWLAFAGPNGSGKTHLAAAIANRRIQDGQVVFFVHVPDLLDHLRATFSPSSELSYSDLFDQVRNAPLLVLDGLGNQAATPWAQEKLQQIVNHRYNAQLPTIITTASEISALDPYIRSRLSERYFSRIVEVRSRQQTVTHRIGSIDPQMLRRMTFDTFDVRGNNPTAAQRASLEAAFQAAKNYAADPDGWLTLFGDTGVGKTHLAVAIAAEQMIKGRPIFFALVGDLLQYFMERFGNDASSDSRATYYRLFNEVRSVHLLILDDLRLSSFSDWAYEELYRIIVYRHNARLPTVITSTEDFTSAAGPIGSRVRDHAVGLLVKMEAPDYRIKEKRGGSIKGKDPRKGAAR